MFNTKSKESTTISGILSIITFNPDFSGLYAVGSYSNSIAIFNETDNSVCCVMEDRSEGTGISHLQFSNDGMYLYAASRKSSNIVCWDIRQTGTILYKLPRSAPTNQKLYFDITKDDNYLVTGSHVTFILNTLLI